jgi:hypothetical protein
LVSSQRLRRRMSRSTHGKGRRPRSLPISDLEKLARVLCGERRQNYHALAATPPNSTPDVPRRAKKGYFFWPRRAKKGDFFFGPARAKNGLIFFSPPVPPPAFPENFRRAPCRRLTPPSCTDDFFADPPPIVLPGGLSARATFSLRDLQGGGGGARCQQEE